MKNFKVLKFLSIFLLFGLISTELSIIHAKSTSKEMISNDKKQTNNPKESGSTFKKLIKTAAIVAAVAIVGSGTYYIITKENKALKNDFSIAMAEAKNKLQTSEEFIQLNKDLEQIKNQLEKAKDEDKQDIERTLATKRLEVIDQTRKFLNTSIADKLDKKYELNIGTRSKEVFGVLLKQMNDDFDKKETILKQDLGKL